MEVATRLFTDTKRLALEEEDLRNEIIQLKNELLVEEQNLSFIKKDHDYMCSQNTNIQQALNLSNEQLESVMSILGTFKKSLMLFSFMRTFIDKTEPTNGTQFEKLDQLKVQYGLILKEYENCPTYKAIVQEELKERELTQAIQDKRNQLMKLETEKEF